VEGLHGRAIAPRKRPDQVLAGEGENGLKPLHQLCLLEATFRNNSAELFAVEACNLDAVFNTIMPRVC